MTRALLAALTLLATPALADSDADALIARLNLSEGEMAARDMPGWTPPTKLVVAVDSQERLEWLSEGLPDSVTLVPVKSFDDAPAAMAGAQGVVGPCSADIVAAGDSLHWIQVGSAGVNFCTEIPAVQSGSYLVTNLQRIHGPAISEHVMAMMLMFTRGLDHYYDAQKNRQWDRRAAPVSEMWELEGRTILVVGLGGIGTEIAKLADGFGMRVIATRNSSREGPDFVDYVGLADELLDLAGQADFVVNAVPLTPDTVDLFDEAFFNAVKQGSYFFNIGRGDSVVNEALIAALESGRLLGAGLDVQDPEPMPEDHPFWSAPNILISPHMSGMSQERFDRVWTFMRENIRRYVAGDKMLNVVDVKRGY